MSEPTAVVLGGGSGGLVAAHALRRRLPATHRGVGYDLLLGVPPHQAPQVARRSGLAAETGFLPVDPSTLATTAPDVYAIGDVTAVPLPGGRFLPKAGVFEQYWLRRWL